MTHHTHAGFLIMIGCDDRRVVVIDSVRGVVVLVLKRDLVGLIPTRSRVSDTEQYKDDKDDYTKDPLHRNKPDDISYLISIV